MPSQNGLYSHSHLHPKSPSALRKSPVKQGMSIRRSSGTLRGSGLAHLPDDDATNDRPSLAHELAVALMPEPNAGSKLLAEEFGIEFDDGAEGVDVQIDAQEPQRKRFHEEDERDVVEITCGMHGSSLADEIQGDSMNGSFGEDHSIEYESEDMFNGSDDTDSRCADTPFLKKKHVPPQDAMDILAQDLASTDHFLTALRNLDSDAGSSTAQHFTLEHIASDVIRRINECVRDREGQVRELLGYEREFRKIAGENGSSNVLGQLDELEYVDDLIETGGSGGSLEPSRVVPLKQLEVIDEEETHSTDHHRSNTNDWELDPHRHLLDDEEEEDAVSSPVKDVFFSPPPPLVGPVTPAKAIPQLVDLRSFTTSLVSSLSTISEHAQVNGVATTDAGRKIRALRNKIGEWRMDWDSAERSRVRIDRWEAGLLDSGDSTSINSFSHLGSKRVDGRVLVEEHLRAFEMALADAALKTQAIMAR